MWKTEKLIELIGSDPENRLVLIHALIVYLRDKNSTFFFEVFDDAYYLNDFLNSYFEDDEAHIDEVMDIFHNLPSNQILYVNDYYDMTPQIIEVEELLIKVVDQIDFKDRFNDEVDQEFSEYLEDYFSDELYDGDINEFKN
jgi:hypothetical protein